MSDVLPALEDLLNAKAAYLLHVTIKPEENVWPLVPPGAANDDLMEELEEINPKKGEASDDMITFLVINTSAITVVPATAIAIRASLGSQNPQQIVVPAIIAATMATIVGVTTVKLIQYFQNKKTKIANS